MVTPGLKIYEQLNQLNKINSAVLKATEFASFSQYQALHNAHSTMQRLSWTDQFYSDFEKEIQDVHISNSLIGNNWIHSTSVRSNSATRLKALRAALGRKKKAFKSQYYQILQELRDILDDVDFKKFAKQIANHYQSVRNQFARLHGKIRALSRMMSLANGSTDRRTIHRKKIKVFFMQSDDEDLAQ